eukprot:316909-Pelagomonas_calceolata.AAC.2
MEKSNLFYYPGLAKHFLAVGGAPGTNGSSVHNEQSSVLHFLVVGGVPGAFCNWCKYAQRTKQCSPLLVVGGVPSASCKCRKCAQHTPTCTVAWYACVQCVSHTLKLRTMHMGAQIPDTCGFFSFPVGAFSAFHRLCNSIQCT